MYIDDGDFDDDGDDDDDDDDDDGHNDNDVGEKFCQFSTVEYSQWYGRKPYISFLQPSPPSLNTWRSLGWL